MPLIFFPVIKTRLVDVTENDKVTPERCCKFQLMNREKTLQIKYFLCLRPSVKTSN